MKGHINMGFNSYKIRDGKHIPTEAFKKNWHDIFGKKKKKKKETIIDENFEVIDDNKENEEYIKELKGKL